MLDSVKPDEFCGRSTKFHAKMVEELLRRDIHIFTEKPFA
jgi:hypothetical protein